MSHFLKPDDMIRNRKTPEAKKSPRRKKQIKRPSAILFVEMKGRQNLSVPANYFARPNLLRATLPGPIRMKRLRKNRLNVLEHDFSKGGLHLIFVGPDKLGPFMAFPHEHGDARFLKPGRRYKIINGRVA